MSYLNGVRMGPLEIAQLTKGPVVTSWLAGIKTMRMVKKANDRGR